LSRETASQENERKNATGAHAHARLGINKNFNKLSCKSRRRTSAFRAFYGNVSYRELLLCKCDKISSAACGHILSPLHLLANISLKSRFALSSLFASLGKAMPNRYV
jgi:hypothetical protein